MGAYKYVSECWRKKQTECNTYLKRVRTWEFRQLPKIVRAVHPSRPEKAHLLGYKAKTGYVVFRCRIRRGGRVRNCKHHIWYGKPRNIGTVGLKPKRSLRAYAEEKVGRKMGSLRVLNSYWVAQDGTFKWFEVICVDPTRPEIRNSPTENWICGVNHKHRELRGLTSANRSSRGLQNKGRGSMK